MLALVIGAVVAAVAIAMAGGRRRSGGTAPSGRYPRPVVSAAIEQAAAVYRIPRWFAWAQADKESSLDPSQHNHNRHGHREDSWGLYQINMNAHRRALAERGLDERNLVDPLVNAMYFGELARGISAEARRRGLTGDAVWYAVRLRLKGIPWEDHGNSLARETMSIFIPYVRRWQGRLGR